MLRNLPRVKRVRSKGREYLYFKTTRLKDGKPVYVKLPPLKDPSFGSTYGALMAGTKRTAADVLTVTGLIDLYRASPKFDKLAAGSQKLYGVYLRAFQEALPTAPANEIDRSDIARLVDKRAATPGAANGILRVVGALYKWGRSRGHVTIAPTSDIELLEEGEHEPWPEAVLEAALACDDERVRLATSLLYYTGQRIGDVCAMRWSDIRGDVIEITQQKRGQDMTIPLHDALGAILPATAKTGLTIIAASNGRRLKPDTVRLWLQKWVKDNHGIEIVAHGLRKNAVNALLECGGSIGEVSAITGQSLQMVEHYARQRNKTRMAKAVMLKWNKKT